MFGYFKSWKLINYISLLALIVLIFGLELYFFQNSIHNGDFKAYLDLTQKIINNNYIMPIEAFPNPLYIFLVIIFSKVKGISLNSAGYFFIPLLSYIALGLLMYKNVIKNKVVLNDNYSHDGVIITLCLMLAGPISFLTFPNMYMGYIGINIYHSPTQILAQPLALGVFLLLLSGLERKTISKHFMLSLAVVAFLSLLAKPSYLICLIPALFLFSLFKLYKKYFININLIFFFFLVNFLVILWQYWLTYGASDLDNTTRIIFAPFAVMRNNADMAWKYWQSYGIFGKNFVTNHKIISIPFLLMFNFTYSLLPRYIASICFPATVYLAFFDTAKKTASLNLAWLTFGIALLYSCFLAESGYRMYHGNFFSGLHTSLFVLFVSSALFLIKEKNFRISKEVLSIKKNPRLFFCSCIFFLHVMSGTVYYFKIASGGWFG